ncbi:hypothetical protein OUQ99_21315 [Streptomonospora nanhaiensis]|uniref:Uncharacterized protein n=1 Tax=Streptomonospora nanhaiensis TaxID=1323731 RepID=A0ABY6YHK8_9ACTN|nr:hypothetical protein [Streptomonospora nanhaiensis]WAE71760.1 hypothetical protein OUQ99_21315 [Streptomonospora nanhaiensis]
MQRITAYLSSLLFSRRDDGYSTETVIITAALVTVAAGLVLAIGARVDLEIATISGG